MIKKINKSLTIKVFLITFVLLLALSAGVIGIVMSMMPRYYKYEPEDVYNEFYSIVEAEIYSDDAAYLLQMIEESLVLDYDGEYNLKAFDEDENEVYIDNFYLKTGKTFDDYDGSNLFFATLKMGNNFTKEYDVYIIQNVELRKQTQKLLIKVFIRTFYIDVLLAILIAAFVTRYITKPIKKVTKIAKQMAGLDFNVDCFTKRKDEIGVLYNSLDIMSTELSNNMEEKVAFFSAASHELKTPITILKGQLEGMLCEVGRYKDRDLYLAKSLDVVGNLEQMVQNLLLVSRLDANDSRYDKKSVSLSELINERLPIYQELFLQKELSCVVDIEEGVIVSGDSMLFGQALDNIFQNAAKYSPQKNEIRIKLNYDENVATLTVENTGVHINEIDIEKLFTPFYRGEQSRNRKTGGTGLGLYLVKNILEHYDGQITIKNSLDGVIVTVKFVKEEN